MIRFSEGIEYDIIIGRDDDGTYSYLINVVNNGKKTGYGSIGFFSKKEAKMNAEDDLEILKSFNFERPW